MAFPLSLLCSHVEELVLTLFLPQFYPVKSFGKNIGYFFAITNSKPFGK